MTAASPTELGRLPSQEELSRLGLREVPLEDEANLIEGARAWVSLSNHGPQEPSPKESTSPPKAQGKSNLCKAEPFLLSEGLPPVPAKLVAKIQSGEFIDMAELLQDNIEATRRRGESDPPHCSSETKRPRREIPDFLSWLQCFGVYASVVANKYPQKFQQLMAYQTLMIREVRRCGGTGWFAYDTMFRQQAANAKGAVDWSKLNTSLYAVSFMPQMSGQGHTCQHCLETDRDSGDCALAPQRTSNCAQQQTAMGLGWMPPVLGQDTRRPTGGSSTSGPRGVGNWDSRRSTTGSGRLGRPSRAGETGPPAAKRACYLWNEGRCDYYNCRFLHICTRCGGLHRIRECVSPLKKLGDKAE